jgi:thiol:disulfide interchange protein/DsbC/DsbD-like thiol-disulfide interchange protein
MIQIQRLSRLLGGWAIAGAALLVLPAPAQLVNAPGSVVTTDQVRAELVAQAPDGVGPGKTVWVGLQLTHKPEWHTYWKNSGDSGLATQLQWTLPEGVSAGEIQWPLPKKIRIGTLANYGYEDTVLLPVPLTISPQFKGPLLSDTVTVKLAAAWLVCKTECIPEEGQFTLQVPIKSSTAVNGAAFDAAWRNAPVDLPTAPGNSLSIDGQSIRLAVHGLPAGWQGRTLAFFPESPEVIETAADWRQAWDGAVWTAQVPLSPQRSNSPPVMPVVLALDGQGQRVEIPVTGNWPPTVAAAPVSTALQAALGTGGTGTGGFFGSPAAAPLGFWAALLGALIGGLILNLMPCVFPILAIKVLGFARHANDRRAHRINGIAYTAGVLVSFVALGMLMLALRNAGEALGWGFQLQNPAVVATLAVLFTLIGLNLAGVFQFAQIVPSSLAGFQPRHPVADAFLTGVLAVAIASPCTAPFMGASLGLAVSLPPIQAIAVFAMLGLGLALPYLLASMVPAVARALPKPGAWMDSLKKFMAFPMFATVAWLVWVLGQQSGIDGAGALLALLVAIAFVAWALSLGGRSRVIVGTLSLAALLALTWGIGPYVTTPVTATRQVGGDGQWQAWAPGRVDQFIAGGQPVFVDFTAAWCVTCQYNKKTTLSDPQVLADLAERKVALLRADWTRRDPAITAALQQLGRNGVPVYVLYQAGRAPVLLSEILSVSEVRAALARL